MDIDKLKRDYHESTQRPYQVYYRCDCCYQSSMLDRTCRQGYPSDELVELVKEGFQLSWPGIAQVLLTTNNIDTVKLLIPLIGRTDLRVSITTDPELINLMRENGIKVTLIQPKSISTISEVVNYVANSELPIVIPMDYQLVISYVNRLKIPYRLTKSTHQVNNRLPDLSIIDNEGIDQLLREAILYGDNDLIELIKKSDYQQEVACDDWEDWEDCDNQEMIYETMLTHSDYLWVDDIDGIYVKLVNVDHGLRYCTQPKYEKYWAKLTINVMIEDIKNVRFFDWLHQHGETIPTVDDIVKYNYRHNATRFWNSEQALLASYLLKYNPVFNREYTKRLVADSSSVNVLILIIELLSRGLIDVDLTKL